MQIIQNKSKKIKIKNKGKKKMSGLSPLYKQTRNRWKALIRCNIIID
jgi:hypothetical protein